MSNSHNATEGSQSTSPTALTHVNLARHNRQHDGIHLSEDISVQKASKLAMAAKSLGIDILDILKDGLEDMEGALPMERFLAENKQRILAESMAIRKKEKGGSV